MLSTLTVIRNHSKTKKHLQNVAARKATSSKTLEKFVQSQHIPNKKDIQIKEAEIKICSFIAEHNIAFKAIDHLEGVLKNIFKDSEIAKGINIKRTKCTAVISNVIGDFEKQELLNLLRRAKFSILSDESTDISANKCICIVVRFFDTRVQKISSSFLELVPIFDADAESSLQNAEHLFEKIINIFKSNDVPLENIIGFGSDGCNLMMGQHNSVSSRFKEICPNIIISKCICHSLHLCASQACKELPRNCEDLARNIYSFFKVICSFCFKKIVIYIVNSPFR